MHVTQGQGDFSRVKPGSHFRKFAQFTCKNKNEKIERVDETFNKRMEGPSWKTAEQFEFQINAAHLC
jgi:hypothetical protein